MNRKVARAIRDLLKMNSLGIKIPCYTIRFKNCKIRMLCCSQCVCHGAKQSKVVRDNMINNKKEPRRKDQSKLNFLNL